MILKISRAWDKELDEYKNILSKFNASYHKENGDHFAKIEINKLEELLSLTKELRKDLVITHYGNSQIIIYDDYLE